MSVYWQNGLRLESADKNFGLKVGGRIMSDWAWFDQENSLKAAIGNAQDGTEFRRARLYISGHIYGDVIFKAQYDFAGGDVAFRDVYLGLRNLPAVGTLQVGQFFEPFGLEAITSSNYLTFMERSLPDVIAPSRNTGIMARNSVAEERVTWAAGVFRDSDDSANKSGDGQYDVTARITGLPLDDGESALFHLGAAYSLRNPTKSAAFPGGSLRYRAKPESHLAPDFVDTGEFPAEAANLLGFEAALIYGAVSFQSEFVFVGIDADAVGDPNFAAFYLYGSYFVTGERRHYQAQDGTFGRVEPKRNFRGGTDGVGAWEVAGRFSVIDLSDGAVNGGEMSDITLGLNWYLNPNTRVVVNYVFSDVEDVGQANILQTRFQIDF